VSEKRTRTTKSNLTCPALRHLFPSPYHPTMWKVFFDTLLLCALAAQPVPAVTGGVAGGTNPSTHALVMTSEFAAQASGKKKSKQELEYENSCLLYGTVFTEQGFALPGAEVKVRRAGEKKYHWQSGSDRRGEFAIRVPQGDQYEIQIKAKGYDLLTRTVDARQGNRQDMVFHMQPAAGGRK
jgi:hypothetical protein